jgi:hypothetical protein
MSKEGARHELWPFEKITGSERLLLRLHGPAKLGRSTLPICGARWGLERVWDKVARSVIADDPDARIPAVS